MTVEQVREQYIEMFGGYPAFLLMCASEETELELLMNCISSGHELEVSEAAPEY